MARASLVAGSIGANPAALLAARLPDLVERLVLIAPAIKVGPAASPEDDNDDAFWMERASYQGATLAVAVAGGHRPDIRSPELINPLLVDFLRGRQLTARPGIEIRQ